MDLFLIFSTAFVIGLSGAMMPGPVTAVLIEQAFKRGFVAAPLVTLGHGLLEALMVFGLAVGLGKILAHSGIAGAIGIAGAAVLVWMGWGMLKSARSGSLSLQAESKNQARTPGPAVSGMLATLANPYWFLWWATIGASYVAFSQQHGTLGISLFFAGHIFSDFAWLSILALAMITGKKFITDRIYSFIIMFLGGFLIIFAGYFFWSGLQFLTAS